MDLRSVKMDRFEAFKGNSLIKSSSSRSRLTNGWFEEQNTKNLTSNYNFDELWRGSVNNLMSSENITEDLIKESIKELENAMKESKRMLTERDEEISKLRLIIDNNKNQSDGETKESLSIIKEQFEKSQKYIVELECELSEIKVKHSREISDFKKQLCVQNKQSAFDESNSNGNSNGIIECTCYCGGNCKSSKELYETRKNLETSKQKYEHLKRRVREFRKLAEKNQQKVLQDFEQESDRPTTTSCSIQ